MRSLRLILPVGLLSLLAVSSASAAVVPAEILARVGVIQPPGADGEVATLHAPFVDATGAVGFVGTIEGGDGFIYVDDAVVFHNSDAMAGLLGGESAMGHTAGGVFVFSPNIGAVSVDGLYTSNGGVIGTSALQAPGMPAGVLATAFARPSMTVGGQVYFVMGVNDGGTLSRVLAMDADGEAGGTTIVLQGGGMVDGETIAMGGGGIDFDYQVSFNGIYRINVLDIVTGGGNQQVVAVNDAIAAREGEAADDEVNWENFDLVAIDDVGNSAWSGDTDADFAADEFIAYNGEIVMREGDTVGGVALGDGSTVRLLSLDDDGNMLFAWGIGPSDETVFYSCDPANAVSNAVYVIADLDQLDFDGDGVADGVEVRDFEATSSEPQRGLGNDGFLYLEVEFEGGPADEGILRIPTPVCCGDALVEGEEECDDDNNDDTDECVACVNAVCGDGFVWAGMEECDDANADDTDACVACANAVCGDGFVQTGVEECDDGNEEDTDDCVAGCVAASCGDGFVQDGVEACDDGNAVDDDACANDCTENAVESTGGESDTDTDGDTEATSGDTDGTGTDGDTSTTDPGTGSASATSPTGSGTSTTGATDTDTDTEGGGGGVGNDGCGCITDAPVSPAPVTLLGLMLLGMSRRRDRTP